MAEHGKRRYDFGGELVPLKKPKNEIVAKLGQRNEITQSVCRVVILGCDQR